MLYGERFLGYMLLRGIMLAKLKSNRGYVFTYEAVVVAMLFVVLFYITYFTYSHNYLSFQEERRNIEDFEKANLMTDMLFKEHEFPSDNYAPDYKGFLNDLTIRYGNSKKIPGTFDIYAIDSLDTNTGDPVKCVHFNVSIDDHVSNVNTTSIEYIAEYGNNSYVKTRNLLVPIKTYRYSNKSRIYEILKEGDILYFAVGNSSELVYINASTINTSSNEIAIFSVNGVPFKLTVSNTPSITEFGKVIATYNSDGYEPNEIRLLSTANGIPVNITIVYNQSSTIYVAQLRPYNISGIVDMN